MEIVFDNTGSNTGLQGLHGLLEKARRERWESYGKQRGEPWVELNVKGCDDHICNLVSKELEKRLCIRWSNWGFGGDGKRHPVSGAVIHMTKRLTSHFRRAFKAFLRENGIKPFGMTRISETRFCTLDVVCIKFYCYFYGIMIFFMEMASLLTKKDIQYLNLLLSDDALAIIETRAYLGAKILLPFMEQSNKTRDAAQYRHLISNWKSVITLIAENPSALYLLKLERKDQNLLVKFEADAAKYREDSVKILENAKEDIEEDNNEEQEEDEEEEEKEEAEEDEEEEKGENAIQLEILGNSNSIKCSVQLEPPKKEKEAPPELNERKVFYIYDAATSFLFHQKKHNAQYLDKLNSKTVLGNSRNVERTFSLKNLLQDQNPAYRAFVMFAIISLKNTPKTEIVEAFIKYKGKVNLKQRGKDRLKENVKAETLDRSYYESQREKAKNQFIENAKQRVKETLTKYLA